jgi:PTH2 family peptidyl-tRNA hydrolase
MTVKQVIIIRKDLKMRRGKEIAQGSHASNAWLLELLSKIEDSYTKYDGCMSPTVIMSPAQKTWISGQYRKICLQIDSEKELLELYNKAKDVGLTAHLITDAGATEFNGIPTKTCLAIGPDYSEDIDRITSLLKLY